MIHWTRTELDVSMKSLWWCNSILHPPTRSWDDHFSRGGGGEGALTYESDVRVPPSTSDVGVFRWQIASKSGSFSDKAHKNRWSWNASKSRGFQGQNCQKLLNISSNLSKFSKNQIFCRKLSLVWLLNAKMRVLWVEDGSGSQSVTRNLLKIGPLGEVEKWGSFSKSERKKKKKTRGVARLFKMRGRQGGLTSEWGVGRLGLKMAALHRPLYKVLFHLGARGGQSFCRGAVAPLPPGYATGKKVGRVFCTWHVTQSWVPPGPFLKLFSNLIIVLFSE